MWLVRMWQARDAALWEQLQRLLRTEERLGLGRDQKVHSGHDRLRLAKAWSLQHPKLWERQSSMLDTSFSLTSHKPRSRAACSRWMRAATKRVKV